MELFRTHHSTTFSFYRSSYGTRPRPNAWSRWLLTRPRCLAWPWALQTTRSCPATNAIFFANISRYCIQGRAFVPSTEVPNAHPQATTLSIQTSCSAQPTTDGKGLTQTPHVQVVAASGSADCTVCMYTRLDTLNTERASVATACAMAVLRSVEYRPVRAYTMVLRFANLSQH